jgi:hypothetical protein
MNSATPEFHEYVIGLRTQEVAANLSFHEDDQLWHTNAFALIRDARIHGRFSWRPVRMGQYFDASMHFGVSDLLRHWCEAHQVDVAALLHRAHATEAPYTSEDLEAIREQAQWEGIVYPPQWTLGLSRELVHALFEVGYPQVARLIGLALMNVR